MVKGQGRVVQGTQRLGDALSKGRNIRGLFVWGQIGRGGGGDIHLSRLLCEEEGYMYVHCTVHTLQFFIESARVVKDNGEQIIAADLCPLHLKLD